MKILGLRERILEFLYNLIFSHINQMYIRD